MHPYDPRTGTGTFWPRSASWRRRSSRRAFLVQWIISERRRVTMCRSRSGTLSLSGGILMTIYGVFRRDPVIILGRLRH